MTIPKDAETLIEEYLKDFDADDWGEETLRDTRAWLRSALASYAAHLAGVLPERRYWPCNHEKVRNHFCGWADQSEGWNQALNACRAAILREAGAGE